jgi:predicted TIM-barrel fold metal-dependent hydrolase
MGDKTMAKRDIVSRRTTLKGLGLLGATAFLAGKTSANDEQASSEQVSSPLSLDRPPRGAYKRLFDKVFATPFIDTHEHLPAESYRVSSKIRRRDVDDWSFIFKHYLNSDLMSAGMPKKSHDKFFSNISDPVEKWRILEPYWPAVKNTGYGLAVRIAMHRLYDVEDLSANSVEKVQAGYEKTRQPGFYKHILCDLAKIESCQVNSNGRPFEESEMPTLLMQDISIKGMIETDFKPYVEPTGIKVKTLADWHSVCDWWFDKYAQYAVAAKSQNAYSRDINYDRIDADKVESLFKKKLDHQTLTPAEQKAIEDHLFWYAVEKATQHNLPVKLHTGYYFGVNRMPLSQLMNNPGSASLLCQKSLKTRFVFMHICYPYYEPMIALAKQFANAYIDMCWAWIINPVGAKDFLKKFLVTAPANKILTFGGDYTPVEPVLGHATIARRGIALALSELVEEGWLDIDDALRLTDTIMHENARKIFDLDGKTKLLQQVKWS